jgi:hypothetical protein
MVKNEITCSCIKGSKILIKYILRLISNQPLSPIIHPIKNGNGKLTGMSRWILQKDTCQGLNRKYHENVKLQKNASLFFTWRF